MTKLRWEIKGEEGKRTGDRKGFRKKVFFRQPASLSPVGPVSQHSRPRLGWWSAGQPSVGAGVSQTAPQLLGGGSVRQPASQSGCRRADLPAFSQLVNRAVGVVVHG